MISFIELGSCSHLLMLHAPFSFFFFFFQFKVERCVSQLRFIIKGDIVSAKQLESKSGSTPTKSECSDVSCESGVTIDSSEECEDSDMENQRWTSLQFAEVTAVIKNFLRLTSKVCNKCGAKNPALEKPMFGWVRMVCPLKSYWIYSYQVCSSKIISIMVVCINENLVRFL